MSVAAFPWITFSLRHAGTKDPHVSLSHTLTPPVSPFRIRGAIDKESGVRLRLYFLQRPEFKNPNPAPKETRLSELADHRFLSETPEELLAHYQVCDDSTPSQREQCRGRGTMRRRKSTL